jgi:LEA14-like dessication related protein
MLYMDAKIILGVAIGAIIVVVAVFAFLPGSGMITNLIPQGPNVPGSLKAVSAQVKPLYVGYNGTSIVSTSDRFATLQTNFYVTNPNTTTIILEYITYDIYDDGTLIGYGEIGQSYDQNWQSSYYFPLIPGASSNVGNSTIIENTGNYGNIWSELQKRTAKFTISGTVYYAIKDAFSGSDYTQDFNFTQ